MPAQICLLISYVVDIRSSIDAVNIFFGQVREQILSESWEGRTAPLHIAAELGRPECAEMILEAGAKVNA